MKQSEINNRGRLMGRMGYLMIIMIRQEANKPRILKN
jgi:hypothetical protein